MRGDPQGSDALHQATGSGEINVPLADGDFSVDDIAGTLGAVVAGVQPRPDPGITTIFDSTGLAIQDVSLARAVYEAARSRSIGQELDMCRFEAGKDPVGSEIVNQFVFAQGLGFLCEMADATQFRPMDIRSIARNFIICMVKKDLWSEAAAPDRAVWYLRGPTSPNRSSVAVSVRGR